MAIERCCLDSWVAERMGIAHPTLWDIRAYQQERLKKVLRYAAERSAFYRTALEKAPDVRCLEDLQRLPVLTAKDLICAGSRMLCVEQEQVRRIYTSGTTAAPKRLLFTDGELSATAAYFTAGSRQFLKPGNLALLLYDCRTEYGAGQLFMEAVRRLGGTPVPWGVPGDGHGAISAVGRVKPALVLAAPETALAMLHTGERASFSTLLLSGGAIGEGERKALSARFGCDVFQQYGLTESAFGLGVDCRAFCGYHLRETDYYVEIVGQDGKTLPAGDTGRVAITSLYQGAMPLIRYDTGDRGRYLPETCPCGSVLPLLDRIRPRETPKGYRSDQNG